MMKMSLRLYWFCAISISLWMLSSATGDEKRIKNENWSAEKFKGNILCLMPLPSPSHHMWNRAVFSALAEKGYNVTALSVEVDPEPVPNLHYIQIEDMYRTLYSTHALNALDFAKYSTYASIINILQVFRFADKIALETKGFRTLLAYPDDFKFDLVIYDYTGMPGMLGFLHKFNYPPTVGLSAFANPPNTMDVIGNPIFPSLVPYYSTTFSADMCFWTRSLNLFYYLHDYRQRQKQLEISQINAEKAFGMKLPFVGDLEKRTAVVLVNTHPAMDVPEPLLPNVVQVAGLQIKDPEPVSKDIKKFIESSKKGAVLFSLGSTLKSAKLGQERIKTFIRALARLPDYHFLWKFEEEGLEIPQNIMVQKWISQNDILAHPKIKLFITHAGLLSTQEATWHGVPMLGVPFFGDQRANTKKSVDAGVAEQLNLLDFTEDEIVDVLTRLLENPSYQTAMSLRSRRFRDRPRQPLQEAVWWCEYVLRHRGAPHLRSAAADMTPLALYMWDLLIVWSAVVLGSLTALGYLLKRIFGNKKCYTKTSAGLRAKKQN